MDSRFVLVCRSRGVSTGNAENNASLVVIFITQLVGTFVGPGGSGVLFCFLLEATTGGLCWTLFVVCGPVCGVASFVYCLAFVVLDRCVAVPAG